MTWAWSLYPSKARAALLLAALSVRSTAQRVRFLLLVALVLQRVLGWRDFSRVLRAELGAVAGLPGLKELPGLKDLPVREAAALAGADASRRADRGARRRDRVRVRVPNREIGRPVRISDGRVRRLQAAVLRRVLINQCGIVPEDADLNQLSRWGSAAWVRRNLLNAAGYGGAAPLAGSTVVDESEYVHRCVVVYPAVLRALAMRPPEAGSEAAGARNARRHAPTIRGSLYPGEIDAYRRLMARQQRDAEVRHAYRRSRREEALQRFFWYCRAVFRLEAARDASSFRYRRALRALERLTVFTGG